MQCATHPTEAATAICTRCDALLCAACAQDLRGKTFCARCAEYLGQRAQQHQAPPAAGAGPTEVYQGPPAGDVYQGPPGQSPAPAGVYQGPPAGAPPPPARPPQPPPAPPAAPPPANPYQSAAPAAKPPAAANPYESAAPGTRPAPVNPYQTAAPAAATPPAPAATPPPVPAGDVYQGTPTGDVNQGTPPGDVYQGDVYQGPADGDVYQGPADGVYQGPPADGAYQGAPAGGAAQPKMVLPTVRNDGSMGRAVAYAAGFGLLAVLIWYGISESTDARWKAPLIGSFLGLVIGHSAVRGAGRGGGDVAMLSVGLTVGALVLGEVLIGYQPERMYIEMGFFDWVLYLIGLYEAWSVPAGRA